MKRITMAAGMESDDSSESDDIVCSSSSTFQENKRTQDNFNSYSLDEEKQTVKKEQTKLFVGNLPEGCTSQELRTLFESYGTVTECRAINSKYGFVRMSNFEDAKNAIQCLNHSLLRGSALKVQFSNGSSRSYNQRSDNQRSRGVSYQRTKTRGFYNQRSNFQSDDNSYNSISDSHRSPTISRPYVDSGSTEMLDDLRYAVTTGNLETAKNILSKGIWIDTILKAGWTGLMYASSSGHSDVVSYFLENKADPNYHKDMYTPLMAVCAARKNEQDLLKCCSLLLQYGANVNAHERHLTTPLMFAAREGYFNIAKELIEHGADLNLQDNRGKTALAWAASSGHGFFVRLLLEKGADQNICDNMGQSPEDLAYESGHNELVSVLKKSHNAQQTSEDNSISSIDNLKVDFKNANGVQTSPALSAKSKTFAKVGELELFLSGIGFSDLVKVFQDHDLNFHDLLIMNEEEFEKIGINQVGVRKKILDACKSVHKKEWQNTSLSNLKQSQYISCPDAVAMMANIAKHLKFLSTSVIYIRQQIQSQPRILELAQDSANVHDLIDEMEDSLKNVRFLNDEMRFLKLHLEKIQDRVQYIPADLIVETVPTSSQRKLLFITISVATTAAIGLCAGIYLKYPSILSSIPMFIRLKLPFSK